MESVCALDSMPRLANLCQRKHVSMNRSVWLCAFVASTALFDCRPAKAADEAKPAKTLDHSGLGEILSFETAQTNTSPAGWGGGPAGTIFVDDKVVHGGHWSARIERGAERAQQQFSSLTKSISLDFTGRRI